MSDLISRLRSRRNRARDIADRQAREARAKSAPAGAMPATGNAGTVSKHAYLSAALERAMGERDARGSTAGDGSEGEDGKAPTQHDLALKAMALKKAGEEGANPMMEDGDCRCQPKKSQKCQVKMSHFGGGGAQLAG